jgi:hypothetical protein
MLPAPFGVPFQGGVQRMATEDIVKGAVEPIIQTVDQTLAFGLVKPGPVEELLFAMIVFVLIIGVHGWSMTTISRLFTEQLARLPSRAAQWKVNALMGLTISLLAVTHLAETLLWAVPIWASGLIPTARDSYYFVLETYTTLGDSNIALPDAWRLIGPMIAISGLFTFSWTGSVLVFVVGETGRRHSAELRRATSGPTPRDD